MITNKKACNSIQISLVMLKQCLRCFRTSFNTNLCIAKQRGRRIWETSPSEKHVGNFHLLETSQEEKNRLWCFKLVGAHKNGILTRNSRLSRWVDHVKLGSGEVSSYWIVGKKQRLNRVWLLFKVGFCQLLIEEPQHRPWVIRKDRAVNNVMSDTRCIKAYMNDGILLSVIVISPQVSCFIWVVWSRWDLLVWSVLTESIKCVYVAQFDRFVSSCYRIPSVYY